MKVHLAIKSYPWIELSTCNSLCGMNPQRGKFDIRTVQTFFHAPVQDQCNRCAELYAARGHSIKKLRADAKFSPKPAGANVIADRKSVQNFEDELHL